MKNTEVGREEPVGLSPVGRGRVGMPTAVPQLPRLSINGLTWCRWRGGITHGREGPWSVASQPPLDTEGSAMATSSLNGRLITRARSAGSGVAGIAVPYG